MSHKIVSGRAVTGISIALSALIGITLWQLYVEAKRTASRTIREHVAEIAQALSAIDAECGIIEIAHDRNYIDFLSVGQFSGARVGPLKLKNPEKWRGPYLQTTPLIQEKMYELIRMKDGFAVVPGNGVQLANGKIIGKDIVFDRSGDIDTFLTAETGLEFEGKPLIAKFIPAHAEVPDSNMID